MASHSKRAKGKGGEADRLLVMSKYDGSQLVQAVEGEDRDGGP